MYFSEIKSTITINDKRIVKYIKNNKIEYIKLFKDKDVHNNIIIKCNAIDIMSPSHNRYKLIMTKGGLYKFNTPKILYDYKGCNVDIFRENINFDKYEIFRIAPINFSIDKKMGRKKIIYPYPYFTNSSITIPHFYINHYLDKSAPFLRISLNDNNVSQFILNGIIVAYLTNENENYSYPLYATTNGLRTRGLYKFITDFISESGKDLTKFIYTRTIVFKNYKFGKIVFNYEE